MAKQNSWFGWVKRLFTSESNNKKPKKWGWGLGRIKGKQYPKITAPKRASLIEVSAEQRKHALTVAIATAAAAEAAIAAAHAAAEVVKLTGGSRSYSYLAKGDRSLAAIKIQSAYRAHLARKALRGLKGVTKLQALIRGQAVRRRVSIALKNSATNAVKIPGKIRHMEESYKNDQIISIAKHKNKLDEKELKVQPEGQSPISWDCRLHSREDIDATWLRKQEAAAKRERMKQYSFSQRERKLPQMSEESVHNKENGKERIRTLGQWLNKEANDWNIHQKRDHASNLITKRRESQEGLSPQISIPRKSFSHTKRSSFGATESSLPNSPVFPTYMAVTESSKAKARSISTPRLRTGCLDTCTNKGESRK
ncbi:IQ-domain [Stylosanthes scabra]|uniref:IQ-domain n=1 Tax=Stylosanthes scabra TaxID=79078 RepID=A0ABU6UD80_9FABA|nr:IQ-domain [Stylosanthes scabra]